MNREIDVQKRKDNPNFKGAFHEKRGKKALIEKKKKKR
jgi:ATP-dependent RNA helicase RhlE